MIILLVHPAANRKNDQHIHQHQQVEPQGRDRRFDDYLSEIPNEQIDRVDQKQTLDRIAVLVNGIEDGRHIHQQLRKHGPEILNVSEEHEQGRKDQPHTNVEQDQAANGVQQQDKLPGKRNTVQNAEQEKHQQRQAEVDKALNAFRQQKQVLRHIDLRENIRIFQQGGHTQSG